VSSALVSTRRFWSVSLQWRNAIRKGHALGFAFGPPTDTIRRRDGSTAGDANWVWEGWSSLSLSDHLSLTTAIFHSAASWERPHRRAAALRSWIFCSRRVCASERLPNRLRCSAVAVPVFWQGPWWAPICLRRGHSHRRPARPHDPAIPVCPAWAASAEGPGRTKPRQAQTAQGPRAGAACLSTACGAIHMASP